MGLRFGELYKIRNIVYYRLSPYEQKAFAGFFSKGFPNMLRRVSNNVFYIVPPFIMTYLIIDWGDKENHRLARKNPADFANDV